MSDLFQRLQTMPPGSLVPVQWIVSEIEAYRQESPPAAPAPPPEVATWREKLWTVPAETRIGAAEVCEAFDRPKSWLYRHTSAGTIPHRKMDGELIFTAGELRAWAREREEIVSAGPMESVHSPHLRAS